MRDKMASGKYGSTHYWLMNSISFEASTKKIVPTATYVEMAPVTGKISKNLNQVTFSNPPYVLLKGTKQAKEVVNAYVNIFLGEEKGHYMGVMGIPDKTYKMDGKNVYTINEDADKKVIPKANIVESMPPFNDTNYLQVPLGATPDQIAKVNEILNPPAMLGRIE